MPVDRIYHCTCRSVLVVPLFIGRWCLPLDTARGLDRSPMHRNDRVVWHLQYFLGI